MLRNVQTARDSLASLLNEEIFAVPVTRFQVGASVGSGDCDAAMIMKAIVTMTDRHRFMVL